MATVRSRTIAAGIVVLVLGVAGMLPTARLAPARASGTVTYERMNPTPGSPHPFPRDAFGVAAGDGDSFYLFGGAFEYFKSDSPLYKHYGDLWKFTWTGTDGTWTLVQGCDPDEPLCLGGPCNPTSEPGCDGRLTSPTVRAFPAMARLVYGTDRYLAVFGGTYFTKTFENAPRPDSFWLYNIGTGTWQNLTPVPGLGPDPRNGSVGLADGSKLYIFGGINAALQTYNDAWEFDLATMTWSLLSPNSFDLDTTHPHSRHASHGALVTYGTQKRLIIYGGEYVDPTASTGFVIPFDTWELNLTTNQWTRLAHLDQDPNNKPTPTRNYAAAAANAAGNLLVLQGGDMLPGVHACGALFNEDPVNEVWDYDRATDTWSRRPLSSASAIPPGAKRHGGVQVGDSMYVMGGWEFYCDATGHGPGQVFNTDVYRFPNP
jgi:hypothetical protein